MVEWWVNQLFENTDGSWTVSLLTIQPPDVAASLGKFYWIQLLYKELSTVYFSDTTICIYMPVASLRYTRINPQNLKNYIFDTVLLTEKNICVRSICCIKSSLVFWTAGNTDAYVQFPQEYNLVQSKVWCTKLMWQPLHSSIRFSLPNHVDVSFLKHI